MTNQQQQQRLCFRKKQGIHFSERLMESRKGRVGIKVKLRGLCNVIHELSVLGGGFAGRMEFKQEPQSE